MVDSSPQLPDETMNGLDVPHVADLARALNEAGWTCFEGAHESGNYDSCADCRRVCNEQVAALTPILSRALAEAAREGAKKGWERGRSDTISDHRPPYTGFDSRPNPYLTEKEQSGHER